MLVESSCGNCGLFLTGICILGVYQIRGGGQGVVRCDGGSRPDAFYKWASPLPYKHIMGNSACCTVSLESQEPLPRVTTLPSEARLLVVISIAIKLRSLHL